MHRALELIFFVEREYRGNPAWLTYSKITLNAARNKITDMGHAANIPFSYQYQSEATPLANVISQNALSYLITRVTQSYGILYFLNVKRINMWGTDPYALVKSN